MIASICPLCLSTHARHYHTDKWREYWQCVNCQLVFVPSAFWLNEQQEKAEYDLHNNQPDDPGYLKFLSRLTQPLLERVTSGAVGLDFGSGPGSALAPMLQAQGFTMREYDKFYAQDDTALQQPYDFITATEVFEHLHYPATEIARLMALLQPGGWLGVMTKRVTTPEAFARWHYIRDRTHIIFFADETFAWLAQHYHCRLELIGSDVALLQTVAK
ncbi:MAG: class I SAM-dependent methyltransferase [Hahellaceae bacterium]|nr:class I SAM-dependent methyltransferase [Hahellaceae bacterium]MCP5168174.1 class I SAM-dependent methyltransferase [Hahellaceae bacterium]